MNIVVTFANACLNYLTYEKKKGKKIHYFPETILCAKTCNLLTTQSGFLSFVSIVLWSWMSWLIQHSLPGPNLLTFCRGWGMPFSKKQLFLLSQISQGTPFSGFMCSLGYSLAATTHSPYQWRSLNALLLWIISIWMRCHINNSSFAINASSRIR